MNPVAQIPLSVEADAAELVAELGKHAELECMLEHARRTIPGLVRLNVAFAPSYDTGPEPSVVIEAYRDASAQAPDDQVWDKFSRWKTTTFPPDVVRHFTLLIIDENNHAR